MTGPLFDGNFEGKIALVTGGASGIGRGIALELARRGADVVLADIHETRLAEVVDEVKALGREALGVRCDVSKDADVESLRDQAFERFGRIDILCNNAGVAVMGPPERIEMADWEWILHINVLGLVRGVRAFVPAMLERGTGYVVNTASIAGTWAYTWDNAPYITSKFAAFGFTESLARSLRPQGIGVSVLCPGLITTNLAESVRMSGVPEERRGEWLYLPPEMLDPKDPEDVGVMVCDAVVAGKFAIFTHDVDEKRFREWRTDIDTSLEEVIANSPKPPRLSD
ncbi:MAG TPA: SDR family oxidoreductase [Frankiaceae bacterium]|jgi:NAD(P)-dependent dehydrogenase (short-subunit alcohol dehydrogenase family)|nr:SDR family oxidoreductase [Frankiaceae bacterium]